jgi:hypothetical protein
MSSISLINSPNISRFNQLRVYIVFLSLPQWDIKIPRTFKFVTAV